MPNVKKRNPQYGGDRSSKFWKQIHALPDPDSGALYTLGVALQNLEGDVLRMLYAAEQDAEDAKQ